MIDHAPFWLKFDEVERAKSDNQSHDVGQRVRAGDAHYVGSKPFRNHDPFGQYLFSKHHDHPLIVRLSGCPMLVQTGIRLTLGRGIATDEEAWIAEEEAEVVHA